jgi:hypothetical protein
LVLQRERLENRLPVWRQRSDHGLQVQFHPYGDQALLLFHH